MLTDRAIINLGAKDKPYRVSDGGGLYIEVRPDGSKYWRQAYRVGGKQKTIAHGVYPTVSLKEARKKRDEAKQTLADGLDPGQLRKVEKLTALLSALCVLLRSRCALAAARYRVVRALMTSVLKERLLQPEKSEWHRTRYISH